MNERVLVLDNIRSAHNVGSIFRTADAAGVSKIYLCGYTPAPIDRFGRKRKDVAKVALGAERGIHWERGDDIKGVIKGLKEDGFEITAVEQSSRSIDYREYKPADKTAYIFGNETEGIDSEVLVLADVVVEIPMRGKKESLNVSVSVGIILFASQGGS